jgi:hypothetical protein
MEAITCAQHAGIGGTLAIGIVNGLVAYAMGIHTPQHWCGCRNRLFFGANHGVGLRLRLIRPTRRGAGRSD